MAALLCAQQPADYRGTVTGTQQAPRIAVPDLLGDRTISRESEVFNNALWNALEDSARFDMVSKSFYPRTTPQRPDDFHAEDKNLPEDPGARSFWLTGWSTPPVTTRYLTFGSLALANERLTLSGYLYDVTAEDPVAAFVFGKRYFAVPDVDGARQLAYDFSRDVLEKLGLGAGLAGTRIYFVSDRSGHREIWAMDYDGSRPEQITNYKNLSLTPAVSPDGTRVAFTSYFTGTPQIIVHSLETGRRLTFYNQIASLNTTPSFTPDGKRIAFASSASGRSQIYMAALDGRNLRRISYSRSIDVDPAVNPRTGTQIAFVSGRGGVPQVYLMDDQGANVRRLSGGDGDAVQPSWDPLGQNVAFAWTRGFEPGNYNIFVMNVATEELVQLTHGAGRNEHPTWSPSGTHITFTSNRSNGTQIWTMRADGRQLRKLTTKGKNQQPFWGVE